MPTWRCPNCGTSQAEGARCWVCRRSSVACSTCADFRHAIAGGAGFCGIERRRSPLRGDEVRTCWRPRTAIVAGAVPVGPGPVGLEPMFDIARAGDRLDAEPPTRFWIETEV